MGGENKRIAKEKGLYNKQEQILDIYQQWIRINQASLLQVTAIRLSMRQIKSDLR